MGKDDPPFSAWGLYGKDDQLGTLNLLTPEVVVEAAKEIKTGVRVGLALPLNVPFPATHNRYFEHKIIHKAPRAVHDDVVHLNTQVGLFHSVVDRCGLPSLVLKPMGWVSTLWISERESFLQWPQPRRVSNAGGSFVEWNPVLVPEGDRGSWGIA